VEILGSDGSPNWLEFPLRRSVELSGSQPPDSIPRLRQFVVW
jgi:hypothetical protein